MKLSKCHNSKECRQDNDIKRCKKCRRIWEEALLTQRTYDTNVKLLVARVPHSCLPKKHKMVEGFSCMKKCREAASDHETTQIYLINSSFCKNI